MSKRERERPVESHLPTPLPLSLSISLWCKAWQAANAGQIYFEFCCQCEKIVNADGSPVGQGGSGRQAHHVVVVVDGKNEWAASSWITV